MIRQEITHLLTAERDYCRPEHLETRLGSEASGRAWRELIEFFSNHALSKLVVRSLMGLGHTLRFEEKDWLFYGHVFRVENGEFVLSYLLCDAHDSSNTPLLKEMIYFHEPTHAANIIDLFRCEAMEPHGATRMMLALMDVARHLYQFDAVPRAGMLAKIAHGLAKEHLHCNLYLTVRGIFACTAEGHYLGALPRLPLPGTPTSQAVHLAAAR